MQVSTISLQPVFQRRDLSLSAGTLIRHGQPMRPIPRDRMEGYLAYFEERCRKSKAMIEEAREYIPGGVQHNLAFNYPFPIAIEKAMGWA